MIYPKHHDKPTVFLDENDRELQQPSQARILLRASALMWTPPARHWGNGFRFF